MVQQVLDAGSWTAEKLALFQEYLSAFVRATQSARLKGGNVTYVDLFAGPGQVRLRETGAVIDGSPLIAMKLPGFSRFVFVEEKAEHVGSLDSWISRLGHARDAETVPGDCNAKIAEVIDNIPRDGPCFVFLDPPSPALEWATVARLATVQVTYQKRKPELLILFPYDMGIARMLPVDQDPTDIWGPTTEEQISGVMPDEFTWRAIYEARQRGGFGADEQRRRFLYLYWAGLKDLGYKYVLGPRVIRSSMRRPLYSLYFASDHDAGRKIMQSVFKKLRPRLGEQLRLILEDPFAFQEGEQWYLELKAQQGQS